MKYQYSLTTGKRDKQNGFSMIEVLVTMLVISLALLGASGMQIYALKLNKGGQFRSQAIFLAADLAERMEANKTASAPKAVNGVYPSGTYAGSAGVADCVTNPCSAVELAGYDLAEWNAAVTSTLPQGSGAVVQTVVGNPSTYNITISWVDRASDTSYENYNAGSTTGRDASGSGERFSYTATRTILN